MWNQFFANVLGATAEPGQLCKQEAFTPKMMTVLTLCGHIFNRVWYNSFILEVFGHSCEPAIRLQIIFSPELGLQMYFVFDNNSSIVFQF